MDELAAPDEFAGRDTQRNDRIGPVIITGALTTEEIGARRSGRNEDQAAFGIDRKRRPRVRRADPVRLLRLDFGEVRIGRVGRQLCRARNRVPMPRLLAAAHVERAHDPEFEIASTIVTDRRADDREVAGNRRRRGHVVIRAAAQTYTFPQCNFAVVAEIRTELAGARVQREQSGFDRGKEDSFDADAASWRLRIAPVADATRRHLRIVTARIDLGVEAPALNARCCVDCERFAGCRIEVQRVADQQRRRLECQRIGRANESLSHLAGAEAPGQFEPADILRRDPGRRRVALSAAVAAVSAPVRIGADRCRCNEKKRGGEKRTHVHPSRVPTQRE